MTAIGLQTLTASTETGTVERSRPKFWKWSSREDVIEFCYPGPASHRLNMTVMILLFGNQNFYAR